MHARVRNPEGAAFDIVSICIPGELGKSGQNICPFNAKHENDLRCALGVEELPLPTLQSPTYEKTHLKHEDIRYKRSRRESRQPSQSN